MGIPVISFGRHNLFSFMDHVFVIRDNTELRGVLTRVCSGQINAEKSWKDGARFYDAIMEISFEMPSFNIVDRKSYDQEGLHNCYNALIKSMPGLRTL